MSDINLICTIYMDTISNKVIKIIKMRWLQWEHSHQHALTGQSIQCISCAT